jgi:hypothetical protein
VRGQEQQDRQDEDGRDDDLRAHAEVLVVDVLTGGPARRAPALGHRPGTLPADQVFTAHRNPFPLARAPTLVLM